MIRRVGSIYININPYHSIVQNEIHDESLTSINSIFHFPLNSGKIEASVSGADATAASAASGSLVKSGI